MKFTVDYNDLTAFFLVFTRIFAALTFSIGFGENSISGRVRLYVAVFLALLIYPLVIEKINITTFTFMDLWREAVIGVFAGLLVKFFSIALEVCGTVIATQSGLSFASFFSAIFHEQAPIYTMIFNLTGSVLFFILDFDILFIKMLVATYNRMNFFVGGDLLSLIANVLDQSFRFGIVMAFPFITAQVAVLIAVGLTNKFTPQTQLFFIMHPVQILIAFLVITVTMNSILHLYMDYLKNSIANLM